MNYRWTETEPPPPRGHYGSQALLVCHPRRCLRPSGHFHLPHLSDPLPTSPPFKPSSLLIAAPLRRCTQGQRRTGPGPPVSMYMALGNSTLRGRSLIIRGSWHRGPLSDTAFQMPPTSCSQLIAHVENFVQEYQRLASGLRCVLCSTDSGNISLVVLCSVMEVS